jgi:hypothetical protein
LASDLPASFSSSPCSHSSLVFFSSLDATMMSSSQVKVYSDLCEIVPLLRRTKVDSFRTQLLCILAMLDSFLDSIRMYLIRIAVLADLDAYVAIYCYFASKS